MSSFTLPFRTMVRTVFPSSSRPVTAASLLRSSITQSVPGLRIDGATPEISSSSGSTTMPVVVGSPQAVHAGGGPSSTAAPLSPDSGPVSSALLPNPAEPVAAQLMRSH